MAISYCSISIQITDYKHLPDNSKQRCFAIRFASLSGIV